MVEDRIAALEARATTLEERVRTLETHRPPWDAERPEVPVRPADRHDDVAPAAPGRSAGPPSVPPAGVPGFPPYGAPPSRALPPWAAPRAASASRPAPVARPARDLEDILGGSVLAWLGGFAILAGLAFLLTIAISRGWLGEAERTVLAGVFSAALLGTGAWLRERRDRTEAALAAAAAGIAGLFGTLVVAGPVYELIPVGTALAGASLVGATATALAVRWRVEPFAWLGLLGALWSPAALGALDGGGIAFLAIAYAATVGVLVWRLWPGLAWAAFATVTVQWLWWLYDVVPGDGPTIVTLACFGTLTLALALGLEIRTRGLQPTAAALIPASAFLLAAVGWDQLDSGTWLAALAVAHLALGLAATRVRPISRELALLTLGTSVLLADAAASALTSDLALALVWAGSALAFAALLGARPRPAPFAAAGTRAAGPHDADGAPGGADAAAVDTRPGERLASPADHPRPGERRASPADDPPLGAPADHPRGGGAPAHPLVAWWHELRDSRAEAHAPRYPVVAHGADVLLGRGGVTDWVFAAAGLVLQLGLAVSHVLTFEAPLEAVNAAADSTALVAVGAIALTAFAAARLADRTWELGLDALALAAVAYFTALALDGLPLTIAYAVEAIALSLVFRPGAIAFAGLALVHAVAVLAPPIALLDGLDEPLEAAAALLAATLALAVATRSRAATALALLYLASVEVVTAGGPEHAGQTLLSVLWALAGVGTLVYGLVTDERKAREGALLLLAITAAKVFLYDLSELDSLARVGSFIGFGLLLLAGAFAWQRVRPTVDPR